MAGPVGHTSILLALAAALAGAAAAFVGASTARPRLIALAGKLAYAVFALVAVAFLAMEVALVTRDFSVSYVARVGSRSTPLFYTIASLWSALEGSILLWALLLTGYTAVVVRASRRGPGSAPFTGAVLGTLLCVHVFFLFLIAGPANPFERVSPVPEDGPGPNPLLQNHPFMAVHPPLLYFGYVGMAVPFAFAVGALLEGRVDREWSRTIRRWTMIPWFFLTLGIVAGAWWSYEVLGWGGYWAWDPVENASFMPWLTATAALHSIMVEERRGLLRTWTLALVVATFLLTLLGTFLTRSGVLSSVHAFAEGLVGPFFLGFLGLALLVSLALLAWRHERLRAPGRLDSPLSRETLFLVNNLLLTLFCFVVLVGTLYPLAAEVLRGTRVSVGAPFFNRMTLPLSLALILLLGLGPALPWGRGSWPELRRKLAGPTLGAVVLGAALAALGVRHPAAWLACTLAALSAGLLVQELVEPAAARRRATAEGWPRALARVATSNRRRYGGYVVHAGVLLIAVGIAASSAYRREGQWTLEPGQAARFGRYAIRLDSIWAVREPHRDAVVAGVTVFSGGERLGEHRPRLNFYRTMLEPVATPAVREGAREDLYLVLMAFDENGAHATLSAITSPLVTWIWAGGVVMGLGALFALWPGTRRAGRPAAPPGPSAPARSGRRTSAAPRGALARGRC